MARVIPVPFIVAALAVLAACWPTLAGRAYRNLGALEAVRSALGSGSDLATAERSLRSAERLEPGAGVYRSLAKAYLTAGDTERAEAAVSSWLAIEPESALARFESGRIQRLAGHEQQALREWREAGAVYYLTKEGDDFAAKGQWARALDYYRAAAAAGDELVASAPVLSCENAAMLRWQAHQRVGRTLYWGARDRSAALAEYQRALELAPDNIGLYIQVGEIYADGRNFSEATRWYERARGIDPTSEAPLLALGANELAAGRFAEAMAYFQEALKLNPNSDVAHQWLDRH